VGETGEVIEWLSRDHVCTAGRRAPVRRRSWFRFEPLPPIERAWSGVPAPPFLRSEVSVPGALMHTFTTFVAGGNVRPVVNRNCVARLSLAFPVASSKPVPIWMSRSNLTNSSVAT
jgi:hypothetical protein